MAIKTLRKEKLLSQEELAERTGLSLRTAQRMESGKTVSASSMKAMAEFFNTTACTLQNNESLRSHRFSSNRNTHLTTHRSIQIVILYVTYFTCVTNWLGYYAYANSPTYDVSLSATLGYVLQFSAVFTVFAYLFYKARIVFVFSYYLVTAVFVFTGFALDYWTQAFIDSPYYQLYFPVFFTLMLLCLTTLLVLQLALSLKGESSAGSLTT